MRSGIGSSYEDVLAREGESEISDGGFEGFVGQRCQTDEEVSGVR